MRGSKKGIQRGNYNINKLQTNDDFLNNYVLTKIMEKQKKNGTACTAKNNYSSIIFEFVTFATRETDKPNNMYVRNEMTEKEKIFSIIARIRKALSR